MDFAIHDTNSGNPHCHIMLTMRPLDERGAWAAKSKKEYDLDENGERIRLPSGRYKTHKWKPCSQKKHAERKRLLKERENLLRNLRRKEIRSVQRSRQKQKLEILKALYRGAHILILDEPTAVLTPQETEELFEQLLLLKESGHTIIFISHKLNEVKALCNRMAILRDGKTMGTYEISDLDEHEISRLMVGREVSLDIEKAEADFGKTVFSVKDLVYADQFGKTRLDHVSFSIKEGQILGIAGIDGNGQSELVEAIVGTLKLQGGQVRLNGEDLTGASVLKRQEAGISHVSEDRMRYGSAPKLSLEDNAISKVYYTGQLKSRGLIDSKKVNGFANRILKEFLVKYDNSKQSVSELSGGNVQKLIVGREFDYDPDLLIMNQPTRGIDVGAIEFIRKKIVDMRARKKAILLVSADLSEILSLSDTILVMHEGRIVGHISDVKNTSENDLGLYMLGVKEDSKEQIGGAYCE